MSPYMPPESLGLLNEQAMPKIVDILNLIECEIDCIESGNKLTPYEQSIGIKVCKNIKNRIMGL